MKGLAGLLFLTLFLVGCNLAGDVTPPPALATAQALEPISRPTTAAQTALEPPPSAPDPEVGAAIYANRCAACHGESGLGDGPQAVNLPNPAAALGDPALARDSSPADWYRVVTQGNIERFMPGFASLNDSERWSVVAYALTLSLESDELERGAALFDDQCAECHSLEGSETSGAPNLGSPDWMASHSRVDAVGLMTQTQEAEGHGSLRSLNEEDRWALAGHIQTLAFAEGGGEQVAAVEVVEAPPSIVDGSITGKVINGTGGAGVPQDLEITLYGFDGQEEVLAETATVSDEGEVIFPGLEAVPGRLFILSTEYQDVRYASEATHLSDSESLIEVPIAVYERTTDTRLVNVDRLHLLLDFSAEGVVQVVQLWALSNLGDRTLAAEDGVPALEVALPEGFSNLRFEDGVLGGRFLPTGRGFGDLAPLRPGRGGAQMVFSLDLPIDRRLEYVQPLDYAVSAVTILVPEDGPRVSGEGLEDGGTQEITGMRLRNYTLGPREAGDTLRFTISTGPSFAAQFGGLAAWNWVAGIAALAGALGVVGWWVLPRRRAAEDRRSPVSGREAARERVEDREELLRAIAAMDDAYDAGELEEDEYHRRRGDLKERLLEIMRAADD